MWPSQIAFACKSSGTSSQDPYLIPTGVEWITQQFLDKPRLKWVGAHSAAARRSPSMQRPSTNTEAAAHRSVI